MQVIESLQSELLSDTPNLIRIRQLIDLRDSSSSERERFTASIVDRFCSALHQKHVYDAAALLRQILRIIGGLRLSPVLWNELRHAAEDSGIIAVVSDEVVELSTRPWHSSWLKHSEQTDGFERRSTVPGALGDGILNALRPAWTVYRSEAQKVAVDTWLFAPPGSTTLVTLPTGGGKSLCTILPAWLESRGGRINSGTTIVVVPTVALALDQQSQARNFFKGSAVPDTRTGADSTFERREIETRLRDGSLPILYTSPESLLGSRLYHACLEAAEEGLIDRLVIDEAHLIESWGAGFRPEFQLLSAFRRKLLKHTRGKLRTLLLSATVSERSQDVLEHLFSEPGKLITVQANRLRPEIAYWFDRAPDEYIRKQRVMEALRFLPRPLILYVTQPVQAERWANWLRQSGYRRIGVFSGETKAEERQVLLADWMANHIDIMVGTSAFGLGVDKGDVRSIIHATLPENIDRFYQEVGRGGRDGYSATSLLCTCQQDSDLAYSLSPKRITFERALPRWQAMLRTPNHTAAGDLRRVNRDAVPAGTHREKVEVDRDWNDHLLLLLQRAGVIQIANLEIPELTAIDGLPSADLLIRILEPRILDDFEYFRGVFERVREQEKSGNPTEKLIDVIQAALELDRSDCIARHFAEIYDDVEIACGGCPACRQENRDAYGGASLDYQVTYPGSLAAAVRSTAEITSGLANKLGTWRSLNVTWSGPRTIEMLASFMEVLPVLSGHGFQQLIVPDELCTLSDFGTRLVRALAEQDRELNFHPHRVIPASWIIARDRAPLYPLATAILYPVDDRKADKVFQAINAAVLRDVRLPACINIVHSSLRLFNGAKLFTEHVDGLTEPISGFLEYVNVLRSNG